MNFFWIISDILVLTQRNLLKYTRLPQLIVFSTIQPVMFVLLFTYVFGGAIKTGRGDYIDYLLPGILVQTVIFGSVQTGIGLADDLSKGIVDRFRSLPMTSSAPLAGRTLADMVRNIFVVLLMSLVGYLIGFRFQNGFANALFAIVFIVLFGFSFSWIAATIGLMIKDVETVQVAGFIWIFPLVFASSIFVPVATMPDLLQGFAKVSPITSAVDLVRALCLGGETEEPLIKSVFWAIGILIFFIPLSVKLYRKNR